MDRMQQNFSLNRFPTVNNFANDEFSGYEINRDTSHFGVIPNTGNCEVREANIATQLYSDNVHVVDSEYNEDIVLTSLSHQYTEANIVNNSIVQRSNELNTYQDLKTVMQAEVLSVFPFICGICDQRFVDIHLYFIHFEQHENGNSYLHSCTSSKLNDGDNREINEENNLYSCGICNMKYPSLCLLASHLQDIEGVDDFIFTKKDRTAQPINKRSSNQNIEYPEINQSRSEEIVPDMSKDCEENGSDIESDTTIVNDDYEEVIASKRDDVEKKSDKKCATIRKQNSVGRNTRSQKGTKVDKTEKTLVKNRKDKNDVNQGEIEESENKYKKDLLRKSKDRICKATAKTRLVKKGLEEGITEDLAIDENITKVKTKPQLRRKDQLFPCEVCGKLFRHERLRHHTKIHENGSFPCDQCDIVCNYKAKLQIHKKYVHAEEMKYTCDECGKPFKAWPYLRQHRLTHNKEKTIQCTVCPMKFTYKALLRKHMLTHTDLKPYTCDICGKTFKCVGFLRTHQEYHSEEKKYECPVCLKPFKTRKDCKKHIRIHQPPKHHCHVCGKGFVQRSNMRIHFKTHGIFETYKKGVGRSVQD